MAKEAFDPDTVITPAQAGDMLGISRKRISQLVQEGFISKAGRGTATILAAARGYARYWQEKASQETKTSADTRVRDARAAEIEQRIAERNRQLVTAAEATAAIDHILAACAEAFAAIPSMITRDIPERTRIEGIVRKAQGEVAKRLAEAAKLLEEGGKLPDAE